MDASKNAAPNGDDEIIDLIDIIEEGKQPLAATDAAAKGAAAKDDIDKHLSDLFSEKSAKGAANAAVDADIDALLAQMDAEGTPNRAPQEIPDMPDTPEQSGMSDFPDLDDVMTAAEQHVPSAPKATPTSAHDPLVNPDESLDMPGMAEVDSLLEGLEIPPQPAAQPEDAPQSAASDDLDALLTTMLSGDASTPAASKPAPKVTPPPSGKPLVDPDESLDMPDMAEIDSLLGGLDIPSSPQSTSEKEEEDDLGDELDALLPGASNAPDAPGVPGAVAQAPATPKAGAPAAVAAAKAASQTAAENSVLDDLDALLGGAPARSKPEEDVFSVEDLDLTLDEAKDIAEDADLDAALKADLAAVPSVPEIEGVEDSLDISDLLGPGSPKLAAAAIPELDDVADLTAGDGRPLVETLDAAPASGPPPGAAPVAQHDDFLADLDALLGVEQPAAPEAVAEAPQETEQAAGPEAGAEAAQAAEQAEAPQVAEQTEAPEVAAEAPEVAEQTEAPEVAAEAPHGEHFAPDGLDVAVDGVDTGAWLHNLDDALAETGVDSPAPASPGAPDAALAAAAAVAGGATGAAATGLDAQQHAAPVAAVDAEMLNYIEERIIALEERWENSEIAAAKTLEHLDTVDTHSLERVSALEARLGSLQAEDQAAVRQQLNALNDRVAALESRGDAGSEDMLRRLEALEGQSDAMKRLASLEARTEEMHADLARRMEALEERAEEMRTDLARRMAALEGRAEEVRADLASRMEVLEAAATQAEGISEKRLEQAAAAAAARVIREELAALMAEH